MEATAELTTPIKPAPKSTSLWKKFRDAISHTESVASSVTQPPTNSNPTSTLGNTKIVSKEWLKGDYGPLPPISSKK